MISLVNVTPQEGSDVKPRKEQERMPQRERASDGPRRDREREREERYE